MYKKLSGPLSGLFVLALNTLVLFMSLILPVIVLKRSFNSPNLLLSVLGIILAVFCFFICFLITLAIVKIFSPNPKEGEYAINSKEVHRWGINYSLANLYIFSSLRDIFHESYFFAKIYYSIFGLNLKKGVHLARGVKILDPALVEIEEGVLFGESSVVVSHVIENNALKLKKVILKKNALIGGDSIIFPGVVVGEDAVVGAVSFVPKDTVIPAGEVWAGIPAKKIR